MCADKAAIELMSVDIRKNRSAGTDPTGLGDEDGHEFAPIEPNAIGLVLEDFVRP